jgi:hypothetical protein
MLIAGVRRERRDQRIRKIWKNFGLSISLCVLFFVSWIAQAVAEWGRYAQDERAHGGRPVFSDYVVQFAQSTFENWQSEFLQLFSFVVLAAVLIHHGSAESKDSDDRMEAILHRIEQKLDERTAP